MKRIILDTNFLMIPHTLGVDIFSEIERIADFKYQLCILSGTIDELNSIIEEQGGRYKTAAKVAVDLIKQKDLYIITVSAGQYLDDRILDIIDDNTIVATQDRGLKRRLKKKGVKLIVLRNKKHLVMI